MNPMPNILQEAAHPARAALEYERFQNAFLEAFGRPFDASAYPPLMRLFGNSRALAERLIANPAWAEEIARSPFASQRKPRGVIDGELAAAIAAADDDAAFARTLRRFKYRELIRLVAQDLNGSIDVEEMLAEWSDIADALIDAAGESAFAALAERAGIPAAADGAPCPWTVIALGKLGGGELNVSSDVDLLFLYGTDDAEAVDTAGACLTAHEWFVRFAAEMTRLLSAVTADGFVFRVDHDLRPEGPQGPLANAFDAAVRYYESFGSAWERQALIRARPIAGDLALGQALLDELRPFIYRRSISLPDIAHMRQIKRQTEHAAARRNERNIKHGPGGIREAEFLVQALQMLHGGTAPELRVQNTFAAIDALRAQHRIHPYAAELLQRSYGYLRRLENMLQAEDDLQTHSLPEGAEGLAALARRMGHRTMPAPAAAEEMNREMARHTRAVSHLFNGLFEADYERRELEEAAADNLARATDEEETADSLAWFRQTEARRLAAADLAGSLDLPTLLARLTLVAEVVLGNALALAQKHLRERHGTPMLDSGVPAGFAAIGMGRLGSAEMDYGSDLDLIFLYAGDGRTDGRCPITNVEFFTKLAQRIISLVTLPTRYGRAYLVDADLRPSGRSGTLVATLASFQGYHRSEAQVWERLALLKARPIAGDEAFLREVRRIVAELAFEARVPEDAVRQEIDRLRTRTLIERAAAPADAFHLKTGAGGLGDLESVIQELHLKHAHAHRSLWQQGTFEVLAALAALGIIDETTSKEWEAHLLFFRRLIARLRLLTASSTELLDLHAPVASVLAEQLGYGDAASLARALEKQRNTLSAIYHREIAGSLNREVAES